MSNELIEAMVSILLGAPDLMQCILVDDYLGTEYIALHFPETIDNTGKFISYSAF